MLYIHFVLTFIWVNLEMIASLSMREASCESVMTLKILAYFRDGKNTVSLHTQWHESDLTSLLSSYASFVTYFYDRLLAPTLGRNRFISFSFSRMVLKCVCRYVLGLCSNIFGSGGLQVWHLWETSASFPRAWLKPMLPLDNAEPIGNSSSINVF